MIELCEFVSLTQKQQQPLDEKLKSAITKPKMKLHDLVSRLAVGRGVCESFFEKWV